MADPLSAIQSLSSGHVAQEKELRSLFLQLEERIRASLSDSDVSVRSSIVVFEQGGDDDAIYGFLSYDNDKLSAAYRTREDDEEDAHYGRARTGESYSPTYSLNGIQNCPSKWLSVLSQAPVLDSFFESMFADLARRRSEADAGIAALRHAVSAPIRDAEAAFEDAARQLGYNDVVVDWQRAQASTYTDPAVAITRASSLIESVLTHILGTKGISLPETKTIQSLLKPTLKALSLSDEDLPNDDLKQMSRGIVTVVQNLGALRTHGSAAHGHGPDALMPGGSEARFAVNVAGAVSTFLMEAVSRID